MSEVWLFAGPTLMRAQAIHPGLPLLGIHVLPPIGRGDLPRHAQQPTAAHHQRFRRASLPDHLLTNRRTSQPCHQRRNHRTHGSLLAPDPT